MQRSTLQTSKNQFSEIIKQLRKDFPDATYELNWESPFQLLIATILAAQCTDERVNQVTPNLFAKYPDAYAFLVAKLSELETAIKPTGHFRQKAQRIIDVCKELVDRYQGEVPESIEELITLPGVARKTANVVLNVAFDQASGIIVDSHVIRVAQRMGWTTQTKGEKIEAELMEQVAKSDWTFFGPAVVLHGRYVCKNSNPDCTHCSLESYCPKIGLEMKKASDEQTTSATVKKAKSPAKKMNLKAKQQSFLEEESSMEIPELPASWNEALADEFQKPYFAELQSFVQQERQTETIFPPEEDVYSALKLTPYEDVNVLLLGQDPYHDDNQAHGLCFSVRPGIKIPPSLKNMYKELQTDLGCTIPNNGYLISWAKQGMLMLNTVLTVRAHQANSHKNKGWEKFTDAIIRKVNEKDDPVIFVLWGNPAQKKLKLIDESRHTIIQSAHPSPLSASRGFFGSKPFSKINNALAEMGKPEIDWQIEDV